MALGQSVLVNTFSKEEMLPGVVLTVRVIIHV